MIHRLLCLIFGHKRATYEYTAAYDSNDEFYYAVYRCMRCNAMIWDDTEEVPRDASRQYVERQELDNALSKCKLEHSEVSE